MGEYFLSTHLTNSIFRIYEELKKLSSKRVSYPISFWQTSWTEFSNSLQMTNKYRKNWSVSTATNKTQLKTALSLLFPLVRVFTTTKDNTRDLGWRAGLNRHTQYSMGISMAAAMQVLYTPPVCTLKEFQVSTPQRYMYIHGYCSTSHNSHLLEHVLVPVNKFRRKCICIQILCGHKNELMAFSRNWMKM